MSQLYFVGAATLAFTLSAILAYGLDRFLFKTKNTTNRYGAIDGLRGILAFSVFTHHFVCTLNFMQFHVWSPEPFAFNILNGRVGVALFFMITGFLFWHKLEARHGQLNRTQFLLNRFFRIAPLFWFHVIVMLVLIFVVQGWQSSGDRVALDILEWATFNFTGRPEIGGFPLTWRLDAGASWTLAYEVLFYLTFPVLALSYKLPRRHLVLALEAGAVMYGFVHPRMVLALPINTKFFAFFLSGALSVYTEKWLGFGKFAKSVWGSSAAVVCILLLYLNFREVEDLLAWGLLTAFFMLVASGSSLFGLLKTRGVLFLGTISYSLYLMHGLVMYVALTLIWPQALDVVSEYYLVYVLCGLSVAVVLISSVTYALVERPALNLFKKRFIPSRAPVLATT